MRILVIGAHGRLGGRLVALLLSRGYSVCALVRRQSQADALREEARGRAEKAASRMGRHADKAASKADKAARRAAETLSDVDWQTRLMDLKERWNPSRVELEKFQISKH